MSEVLAYQPLAIALPCDYRVIIAFLKVLHEINLQLIDEATCQKEWNYQFAKVDIKKQLCAGERGRSSCQGDSGGETIVMSS